MDVRERVALAIAVTITVVWVVVVLAATLEDRSVDPAVHLAMMSVAGWCATYLASRRGAKQFNGKGEDDEP